MIDIVDTFSKLANGIGSVIAIGISVISLIRSNRKVQNEALITIQSALSDHITDDARLQSELASDLKNNIKLTERIEDKLDRFLERK